MTPSAHFLELHQSGCFVMPNPFDAGSARLMEAIGFPALATTSAGLAATFGMLDMTVTRDQLVAHVAAVAAAITVPLNVDSERCFAETESGIAETVELLADAGASGCSIEDWDPAAAAIDDLAVATARVRAAAAAATRRGMVLTARCENHLHGINDLDDTVIRLRRYAEAGAHVVYAPGLVSAADISRVVAIGTPLNVLLLPGGPSVEELRTLGVRRVSIGSGLANIAYGSMSMAAEHLRDHGQFPADSAFLDSTLKRRAFAR